MVRQCTDQRCNETLTSVLQGQLHIDLEDRVITLSPGQGVTITKGVTHRTRAPGKTVMLMVETSDIVRTGNYQVLDESLACITIRIIFHHTRIVEDHCFPVGTCVRGPSWQ